MSDATMTAKRQSTQVEDSSGSTTARHRVREEVRRLILIGDLRPGERLTQQHLAKRFGVAQSVVRESLLELQFSGLVHMVDNLGIFVGDMDTAALLQAYEVREMLEGLAARGCCEQASRADVRELSEMVEELYRLGLEGNDALRGPLDRRFHVRTIEISKNEVLERLTQACHALGMTIHVSRPHEVIRDEHMAIVKAIEANNPDEAERTARAHIANARQAIRQQIEAGTFVPKWVVD